MKQFFKTFAFHFLSFFLVIGIFVAYAAVTFPSTGPGGVDAGGKFMMYFNRMLVDTGATTDGTVKKALIATTQPSTDVSTKIATTAFVNAKVASAGAGGGGGGSCYTSKSPISVFGYGEVTASSPNNVFIYTEFIHCPLPAGATCTAFAPGAGCLGGTTYAFYMNGHHYMTTPGDCDNRTTPFCYPGYQWGSSTTRTELNWQSAIDYCANMSYGGYTDWKLPTKDELWQLQSYMNRLPQNIAGIYWTSTEYDNTRAFFQNNDGQYGIDTKTGSLHLVRCVRIL